jgi:hypothetical protein
MAGGVRRDRPIALPKLSQPQSQSKEPARLRDHPLTQCRKCRQTVDRISGHTCVRLRQRRRAIEREPRTFARADGPQ